MTIKGRLTAIGAASACAVILAAAAPPRSVGTVAPYIDPAQLTHVPFGSASQWAQPWRAYMDTVPATTFINGTGVTLNTAGSGDQNLMLRMLASHGISHARIEIPFGAINYNDERQINGADSLTAQLRAAKRYGVRPLILLNANQGFPVPSQQSLRAVARTARAGATVVRLTDVRGLKLGYSGMDMADERLPGRDGPYTAAPFPPTLAYAPYDWAAGDMITAIHGHDITLAKPLKRTAYAGVNLHITTLKYRPFSVPGSADYNHTMAAWLRYVHTTAGFVTAALGTAGKADKGFDLEIWNELSQAPHYLFINDYYGRPVYHYDETSIYHNLVAATARYVSDYPTDFSGVQLGDGIASNIPWPAASTEPSRINAISKHPYQRRIRFPQSASPLEAFDKTVDRLWNTTSLDASYHPEAKNYVPTYSAFFPEYFATALRGDSITRDMAPLTTMVDGVAHGRDARVVAGRTQPVSVWLTEVALSAKGDAPRLSRSQDLYDQAKIVSRYFCFYLGKGATQVDIYAAAGYDSSDWEGLLQPNFLNLAASPHAFYPRDDHGYTTPALLATGRIAAAMRGGLDRTMTATRPLRVLSVSDTHNHWQFAGDGTAAHPTLYDRDVFTFLPFQVNAHRFVIPYYVMTRDVLAPFKPEQFTVRIAGVHSAHAALTAYDPIKNVAVPVQVVQRDGAGLTVTLTAADYPYLLTVQE